ncbi:MAG: BCD family MFS transporter [Rhodovarius sp.]|nr:BCD family MFS transporter [Rhodovarius sp.]MDW8313558.1 BCD family MFS transporter [Rhodovarius sp.]
MIGGWVIKLSQRLRPSRLWMKLGTEYLPFADAGSANLPMARLARLSLFQVSCGLCSVLLIGTLNRVMIVELHVPAALVATMLAIPVLFAPFRALIGFRSDRYRSALGWRRFPYIWKGQVVMFGGLSIMPFALILLSGDNTGPAWTGPASAAIAFLVVGIGLHTVQTAGLALVTDLTPPEKQPQAVAFLSVMLLLGMFVGSLAYGAILSPFSQFKLIAAIQGSALLCMALTTIAMWKQEARRHGAGDGRLYPESERFLEAWRALRSQGPWLRRLVVTALGTAGFVMQDILLEPYGGQLLGLSVSATTLLTSLLAGGGIFGFIVAARRMTEGTDPHRVAGAGAMIGVFAFAFVLMAAPAQSPLMLAGGAMLIGFGAGLFAHATLTSCMQAAPPGQGGLALGLWGAANATAAGAAIGMGGWLRDTLGQLAISGALGEVLATPLTGYATVYGLEMLILFATALAVGPLVRTHGFSRAMPSPQP